MSLLAPLAACGGSEGNENEPAQARSSKVRAASSAPAEVVAAVARDNADFAMDLYGLLGAPGDNLFFSPHSISTALAMTYAGAAGTTREEMKQVLHFRRDDRELHAAFNSLDAALETRGSGKLAKDGTPFRFRAHNSVWGDADLSFEAPFLDTLAEGYGAGVFLERFRSAHEPARARINAWTAEKTEQRIKEILPAGSLDPSTRLVLVNAVYFNAGWDDPFEVSATVDAPFHGVAGDRTVKMMRHAVSAGFARGDGWVAADLPYAGSEMSLLVVVPTDWATFKLDGAKVASVVGALAPAKVDVSLPRVTIKPQGSTPLSGALKQLGMRSAFEAADFSGITRAETLLIDEVHHQAFLELDEQGTEAAAATVVEARAVSGFLDPPRLQADRPFFFAIRDRATGALVFVGRYVAPS